MALAKRGKEGEEGGAGSILKKEERVKKKEVGGPGRWGSTFLPLYIKNNRRNTAG